MYRDAKRYGQDPTKVVRSKTTFNDPIKWAKNGKLKHGSKIFVCSLSDFFIEEADEWRDEAWSIIRGAPYVFQLCTKRPERIRECLPKDWEFGYKNVWLGVTGENQALFDMRVDILSKIPAEIHWVSVEPQLERVHMSHDQALLIDWVVVGGESGSDARLFDQEWIGEFLYWRALSEYNLKLFVKQLGSNPVGLKLKHPHGADPSEWREMIRIQEFPKETA